MFFVLRAAEMRLICRSSLAAPGRFRPGEIEIVDAAPWGAGR